jgi:hypothetical protein
MSNLIDQMDWGKPILLYVKDPEWEAEVKAEVDIVPVKGKQDTLVTYFVEGKKMKIFER